VNNGKDEPGDPVTRVVCLSPARLSPSILSEPVTISGGVAERVAEGSRDALLERADRALYRARAAGRNRTAQG
jgi:PleD family two-component response regulator